jgi:outer membrane protein insertion porin family
MGMTVKALRRLGLAALLVWLGASGSVAVLVGIAGPGFAQSAQTRVDVEGNRRVEADTIRSYFLVGGNERLDAAKIDAALKALYATGLFQDVRITPSNGRILVTVVENPVLNRVAFEGNHKAKDEQLATEVQSKARGTFSRAQVQSDVQRIIEIYQRSGRYDVRVDPKIIELPNGRVDLIFEITEGAKTGVAKIVFVGNKAYSDYRLRDVIKTGETNWLSFLKSNDMYDPDRIEADRDLLRRFYLKNGYADVRIVSASGEYDPEQKGFIITFTIDEGVQYHFGIVNIQSGVPAVPGESLRYKLRVESGRIYNADAIEKSVEDTAIEMARRGYPFTTVRPRGDRNYENRTVNITFLVEEGSHTYIERINIKGNTRTHDYVIRREFDIVEGDAYNRALVDRAERRIKNLGYFKNVKITTEPGSAPDRIILNCDLEEQSTGEFSIAGGYSTSDGIVGEVSLGERNLLGTGQAAKVSVQYGEYAKGFNLSFVEPYFLDQRLGLGFDVFAKQTIPTNYLSYGSTTIGGDIKLGIPIAENLSTQLRYTGYQQQISLSPTIDNCNNINPDFVNTFPTPDMSPTNGNPAGIYGTPTPAISQGYINYLNNNNGTAPAQTNCFQNGQASLAVRRELAQGAVFVSSTGYTMSYNTLDNNRSPANGLLVDFKQDFAAPPGDVNFVKSTFDARLYNEIFPDIVGLLRVQGGYATGWGQAGVDGQGQLRMLDQFQAGPNLVRGFAPAGFGPRDITEQAFGYVEADPLGGSLYWASTIEFQTPLPYAPKDFGVKLAAFADAGQLTHYSGPTSWSVTGEKMCPASLANLPFATNPVPACRAAIDDNMIRTAIGVGIIWDSPFGPLRFDLAWALTKEPYDHTQIFRFGGGTRF